MPVVISTLRLPCRGPRVRRARARRLPAAARRSSDLAEADARWAARSAARPGATGRSRGQKEDGSPTGRSATGGPECVGDEVAISQAWATTQGGRPPMATARTRKRRVVRRSAASGGRGPRPAACAAGRWSPFAACARYVHAMPSCCGRDLAAHAPAGHRCRLSLEADRRPALGAKVPSADGPISSLALCRPL